MDSSFRLRCPACQARIKAPFQLLGHTRDCPQCGDPLVLKPSPPQDAGPAFLADPVPAALASNPDSGRPGALFR